MHHQKQTYWLFKLLHTSKILLNNKPKLHMLPVEPMWIYTYRRELRNKDPMENIIIPFKKVFFLCLGLPFRSADKHITINVPLIVCHCRISLPPKNADNHKLIIKWPTNVDHFITACRFLSFS